MTIFRNEHLSAEDRERLEKEGHLIYVDGDGAATALVPGCLMGIVTDPTRHDGTLFLILTKVTKTKLQFVSFSKLQNGKEGERRHIVFQVVENKAV